ncbi:MAG: hypothetical protein AAGF92_12285 [Myxococcota bacterium]
MAKPEKKAADSSADVALVYGRSEDGKSLGVLRRRHDEIQVGTLRTLEQGKPIHGELVKLRKRDDSPLFDVETQDAMPTSAETSGPAKVSTPAYRAGWDSIWSEKSGSRALN